MTPEQNAQLRSDNTLLAQFEHNHERSYEIILTVFSVVLFACSVIHNLIAVQVFSSLSEIFIFIRNRLFIKALSEQRTINERTLEINATLNQVVPQEVNWYERGLLIANWIPVFFLTVAATLFILQ